MGNVKMGKDLRIFYFFCKFSPTLVFSPKTHSNILRLWCVNLGNYNYRTLFLT